ncbi:hypothetical protein NQ315_005663 [Exocentrus adspersus]|uniref:Transposase Helix-turn-helix domain-containing protein n=1 Tax=Exocentrus adspersus TaxID=1586481 RepID=A0AAV8VIX9_9CUCU|nr:hypothetical protein NQ315_005663 [Exocentrus adspersus]
MWNMKRPLVRVHSKKEFKKHFRINRSTANRIIGWLDTSNVLPKHSYGREKINSQKAFLLTLWYLSNTETFRQVADRFNVSESSSHRDMKKVLDFLLSQKSSVIQWPDANTAREIEGRFRMMKGIRNVIGCIDGSHIEISKPKDNQESYYSRKGYHSLLLQSIVN